jgi:hypothetical protein
VRTGDLQPVMTLGIDTSKAPCAIRRSTGGESYEGVAVDITHDGRLAESVLFLVLDDT